jgi:hypothetical protein
MKNKHNVFDIKINTKNEEKINGLEMAFHYDLEKLMIKHFEGRHLLEKDEEIQDLIGRFGSVLTHHLANTAVSLSHCEDCLETIFKNDSFNPILVAKNIMKQKKS